MSSVSRWISRVKVLFDEDSLVANAGLILPATLIDSAWDPRVLLTLETRMEHGKASSSGDVNTVRVGVPLVEA